MSFNPSKLTLHSAPNSIELEKKPSSQFGFSAFKPAPRMFGWLSRFVMPRWLVLPIAFPLAALMTSGCSRSVPTYLNETGSLNHYLDKATKIDYPDVEVPSLDEVTQSHGPMTVIDPDFQSYEDLTLEDAVSYSLQNAKILRGYGTPSLQGTRVSPGQDNLVNGPAAAGTIYNVAVRETEPGFIGTPGQLSNPGGITTNTGLDGNQGVEAALADFDAQFTTGLNFTKTDEPRNTIPTSPISPLVFQQDQAQWQSEVAKKSANGTQVFFRNVNTYQANSNPLSSTGGLQVLDSWYRASFEAEVRQPLLRGRGAFINRMPVVISRIGTDQELANLESQLQNFVTNIEIRYWDLYCAYRNLEASKTGRDAALQTWRIVKDQFDLGADANIQQAAQASEQYHFFDAQVIDAYNSLLNAEGQLRFLMGWSSTDGRVLRPSDEPVMAPLEFSWCESLCESLSYRPELRQERWEIKKKELALAYSKNGLLPELNATALYRWLGLGNKYGTSGNSLPFPDASSGALNELYGGDYQELQFGVDFRMPIGFRRELANVRNAQLKLAREIGRMEDMELDISKELSEAFRALAANQLIMQASYNRWKDTTIEKNHFDRLKDAGVATLDVALDAQRRRSQAEIAFYTAMCEYNKVIALIHRRKGTILPYCGVEMSEGPWAGKAYLDANEHARRRSASRELNYGWTRPQVISRGEDWPSANNVGVSPQGTAVPANSTYPTRQPVDGMLDDSLTIPMEADDFNQSSGSPTLENPSDGNSPGSIKALSPTPAARKTSQIYRDSNVQSTSYTEPVTNAPQPPKSMASQSSNQPVSTATRIPTLREPARDNAPPPTQRLKASTPMSSAVTQTQSQPSNDSTSAAAANQAPVPSAPQASQMNWERMGMSRPTHQGNGSVARIKTNQ